MAQGETPTRAATTWTSRIHSRRQRAVFSSGGSDCGEAATGGAKVSRACRQATLTAANRWSSVTTEAFVAHAQRYTDADVAALIDAWVYGAPLPALPAC